MPTLHTQAPEVTSPEVNILTGSFQQASQGPIGSLAEGLEVGLNTLDRGREFRKVEEDPDAIDDELFIAALENTPGMQELDRTVEGTAKRNAQTGRLADSSIRILAKARQQIANGVPVEVVARTLNKLGTSVAQLQKQAHEREKVEEEEDPRDALVGFLHSEDMFFTSDGRDVRDLNMSELSDVVRSRQKEIDVLRDAKEEHERLSALEGTDSTRVIQHFRTELAPAMLQEVHKRGQKVLNEMIEARILPVEFVRGPDGVPRQRIAVEEIDAATLLEINDTIDSLELELLGNAKAALNFRGSSADREAALSPFTNYFTQLRKVISGEHQLERLDANAKLASTIQRTRFLADNPDVVEATMMIEELSGLVDSLGPVGLEVKQEMADLAIQIVRSPLVNLKSELEARGIDDPVEAKALVKRYADYIVAPEQDIDARGRVLGTLLQTLANTGEEDPNLYHAMLEMLAHPEGPDKILKALGGVEERKTREKLARGFRNYREQFENQFINKLQGELTKPISNIAQPSIPDAFDAFTRMEVLGVQAASNKKLKNEVKPDEVVNVPKHSLVDFVDQNLYSPNLNPEALKELSERDREYVIEKYRQFRQQFDNEITDMVNIQSNLFKTEEKLRLSAAIKANFVQGRSTEKPEETKEEGASPAKKTSTP